MGELLNLLQQSDASVSVTIGIADLRKFAEQVANEVAERLRDTQPAPSNEPELMTINEVVKVLGVTKPTLWRWDKIGYLTKVMVGNSIRYRSEDVKRIMNNKTK